MESQVEQQALTVCHDCDLVVRVPVQGYGWPLCCPRCQAILDHGFSLNLSAHCAWLVSALIALVLANVFPLVALSAQGNQSSTTLLGTVIGLWQQQMPLVAILVALTAIMVPLLELLLLTYLQLPLLFNRVWPGFRQSLVVLQLIHPWSMTQVFLIGILVALVKLARLADVVPGIGLWSFAALIILLTLNISRLDASLLWKQYQKIRQLPPA